MGTVNFELENKTERFILLLDCTLTEELKLKGLAREL